MIQNMPSDALCADLSTPGARLGVARRRAAPDMLEERFSRHVLITASCWLWRGAVTNAGYGQVTDPETYTRLAHRWSYENLVELIPDGMHIDHLCRVRLCVNPDHLEVVTPEENQRRAAKYAPPVTGYGDWYRPRKKRPTRRNQVLA